MRATIENYRGFDIEFDTDSEKFICIVTEENAKESKSFAAVKKFIDDYKKENQDFNPFQIVRNPQIGWGKDGIVTILGLRKDGRFIAEDEKCNKFQISDYEEKHYIVLSNEDIKTIEAIEGLKNEEKRIVKEFKEKREALFETLVSPSLDEYKKTLLQ